MILGEGRERKNRENVSVGSASHEAEEEGEKVEEYTYKVTAA